MTPAVVGLCNLPLATIVLSTAQCKRRSSCESPFGYSPTNLGVVLWELAIQKCRKKCLDLDGSMKSKN